jgi:hypothetical protein
LKRFGKIDPNVEPGEQEAGCPFLFSKNNPIKYNDPDGKCPTCPPGSWEIRATQDGKLGKGLVESGKGTVTSLYSMVTHPVITLRGWGM